MLFSIRSSLWRLCTRSWQNPERLGTETYGLFAIASCRLRRNQHCATFGTLKLMRGNMAVEIFFVLSGFYMALVLDTKYGTRSWNEISGFYASRFFRLWPTFILTTLAAHALWLFEYVYLGHPPLDAGPVLEWSGPWFAAAVRFSNLFMIGQDVPSWFHVSQAHGLHLTFGQPEALADGSIWAGHALEIGPAWSIGTEIWFYLVAPFLMRGRTGVLATIALAGLGLRYYMETRGALAYFFFPAQLPLFLAGAMAYRLRDQVLLKHRAVGALPLIAVLTWTVARIDGDSGMQLKWLVYGSVAAGMPALFRQTKGWRVDRAIGRALIPCVHRAHASAGRAPSGSWTIRGGCNRRYASGCCRAARVRPLPIR